MTTLTGIEFFQGRPIGRTGDGGDVFLTFEFFQALVALRDRVGGFSGEGIAQIQYDLTGGTFYDDTAEVELASVTINSTGGPLLIRFSCDLNTIDASGTHAVTHDELFRLKQDGSNVVSFTAGLGVLIGTTVKFRGAVAFEYVLELAAGTYVFSITAQSNWTHAGGDTAKSESALLTVSELKAA